MKPSIPKGTRDFSPTEMVRRNYIFDTIKQVFQLYGYLPIETPAMENLETLMGKYGEEGDRLIFKILNSGNYLAGFNATSDVDGNVPLDNLPALGLTNHISEKALRYDLTVPFARYVVQHQNEITFPFKRYQIQPVWRADRPQKGRYREFYQCDADVIGSNSLINEVELIQIINDVFTRLNLPVVIKINNRKILQGLAEVVGVADRMLELIPIIDKLDKISMKGVEKELESKNFTNIQIEKISKLLLNSVVVNNSNYEVNIGVIKELLSSSVIGMKGLEEIEKIFDYIKLESRARIEFDITLARGLNYYTGAIIEVKADAGTLTSSICGGGRYDDLTGIFGLPNVSGVGISFGADRIYDVLNELNLFPESVSASTKLLFVAFDERDQSDMLPLLATVRKAGINSEIYPNTKADAKKQYTYGETKKIPFVVSVKEGVLTLKNIVSGEKEEMSIEDIIEKLK